MSRRNFFSCLVALATAPLIIGCGGNDTTKKKDDKAAKPKPDTNK